MINGTFTRNALREGLTLYCGYCAKEIKKNKKYLLTRTRQGEYNSIEPTRKGVKG